MQTTVDSAQRRPALYVYGCLSFQSLNASSCVFRWRTTGRLCVVVIWAGRVLDGRISHRRRQRGAQGPSGWRDAFVVVLSSSPPPVPPPQRTQTHKASPHAPGRPRTHPCSYPCPPRPPRSACAFRCPGSLQAEFFAAMDIAHVFASVAWACCCVLHIRERV